MVVAVQFHQLTLEVVAGGAEEADVGGGDEDFGDVGVVVHGVRFVASSSVMGVSYLRLIAAAIP